MSLCDQKILCVIFVHFIVLWGGSCGVSADVSEKRHILMINSYHQRMPWVQDIVRGVEDVLQPDDNDLVFHIENMDSKEFHSEQYFAAFKTYLAIKYKDQHLKLLLCSDNNAYDFLRKHRDELFPGVPIFFCGVNNFADEQLAGLSQVTGATEVFSADQTIRQALQLVPGVKRVYVVNDYLKTGRFWETDIKKQVAQIADEVVFEYAENLSMDELLQKLGTLPADTIVLLGAYFSDRHNQFFSYEDVATRFSEASSVPVFSLVEFIIDEGMVGGQVISGYYQGRAMAGLVQQFLQGTDISQLPVLKKGSNQPIYNYQQLQRFGLQEHRLPPEALVVLRPYSFYEHYRYQIWVVSSFICVLLLVIILLVANVQRRKRAELALIKSGKRFRQLAESTWEALIFHDGGVLLEANQMFTQLFGYQVEEVRGKQIVPILFSEKYQKIVNEKLKRKDVDKYEALALHKDGTEFPIEVRIRHMEYEGKEVRVAAIRDLTERKNMEEQLSQSRKLEAIGTLAGGIAHDFNNILSAIIGYAEILLLKKTRDEQDSERLEQILQAGNRARLLVQQILTFARKSEEKTEQVQMSHVVREVEKLLRATLPATIEIVGDIGSEGCVQGDTTKMHQLVMNLCTNAGKAMPTGGIIRIGLHEKPVSTEMAQSHSGVTGGVFLCLSVVDSGRGIPAEALDKIFDPFYTTEEDQSGTGLGLSVVHGIVQESRGFIEVESKEGSGSHFKVFLPKVHCPMAMEVAQDESLPHGTESIMVIDDEDDLIDIMNHTLSGLGYEVHGFTDGQQAVAAYTQAPEAFDLVITDMNMPKIQGDEVARRLLECTPAQPIIICSGYSESFQESDALDLGIKKFLVKPVSMTSLATCIRQTLDN